MTQNNNTNRMTVFIRNNKNLLIALVAIIVVVLLAIMLPRMTRRDKAVAPKEETVEETDTTTISIPVSANPEGEAAYKSAIAEHEGRLVTVMDGCVAEPKTQSVATGERVLLVNASKTTHTFMVGTDSYTVGERHYKTLRMNTAGEFKVSCDETKDIATITVK